MIKFWRCEYTGEIIVGTKECGGAALFGFFLPFLGFKWTASDADGCYTDFWPPRYVALKLGVMWLGHGLFYGPPWRPSIKKVAP